MALKIVPHQEEKRRRDYKLLWTTIGILMVLSSFVALAVYVGEML